MFRGVLKSLQVKNVMDIGNLSLSDFSQGIMNTHILNSGVTYILPFNLATGQEDGQYATFCISN